MELGGEVNAKTNGLGDRVYTPLVTSITGFESLEMMDELLKHGADPLFIDPTTGSNLFHFLADDERVMIIGPPSPSYTKDLITKIQSWGVDINKENKKGKTPLVCAREKGNHHMAEAFQVAGAR